MSEVTRRSMAPLLLAFTVGAGLAGCGGSASSSTPAKRHIFATGGANYRCDFGGLAAADNQCNLHAQAAGLNGVFKAWLSDDSNNAIDRIADVGPWYGVGTDTVVALNKATLALEYLNSPLTNDENGRAFSVLGSPLVWTGTGPNGLKDPGNNCSNWTSLGGLVYTSQVPSSSLVSWHNSPGSPGLPVVAVLICIEQ